ncbi:unnamed protein product [Orchesella dallaii]|uniref:Uncharacterized protein n=1 Tax=Orchesella dallaii TaxID=48710 RepID=A0ABP1QF15_9HEXA
MADKKFPPPRKVGPSPGPNQGRRRSVVERENKKIGYGNLDDWNALPPADQARILGHSAKLLDAFRITKVLLKLLGIFPFSTKKLNRCGNTWGRTVLSRNMPAVVFVWTQLMLTTAGNMYVLLNGKSFLSYYNCVNEAVMQLDVDPTGGMRRSDVRGNVVFGTLFIICLAVFASGVLHSLEEVSAFVIQAIVFFFKSDLVFMNNEPFWARDFEELHSKCSGVCKGCMVEEDADYEACKLNGCFNAITDPAMAFKLIKWAGFGIWVGEEIN